MSIHSLPRENLIYMDDKIIEIDIPDDLLRPKGLENIKAAKGILQGKEIDPVQYQKDIRSEWP